MCAHTCIHSSLTNSIQSVPALYSKNLDNSYLSGRNSNSAVFNHFHLAVYQGAKILKARNLFFLKLLIRCITLLVGGSSYSATSLQISDPLQSPMTSCLKIAVLTHFKSLISSPQNPTHLVLQRKDCVVPKNRIVYQLISQLSMIMLFNWFKQGKDGWRKWCYLGGRVRSGPWKPMWNWAWGHTTYLAVYLVLPLGATFNFSLGLHGLDASSCSLPKN